MAFTDHHKHSASGNNLAVVSPYTHLAGHYWPYTVDTATAMAKEGVGVTIYAALPPRDEVLATNPLITWKSCARWTLWLRSIEKRNLTWGSRFDNLLRNLEFSLCLNRALQSPGSSYIYCIESRHRTLLHAVLSSKRSFSTLCVGSPDDAALAKRADLYRRAFGTGRLTLVVETEAVRRDWEPLAGEHVVHIPAAVADRSEPILSKNEARMHLRLPEDAFICLFFGTHREGKDYRTAIEAAKLSESKPYLLFVGPLISGNDPEALLKEFRYDYAGVWNRYYPDDGLSELFDACNVVVLPYANGYVKGSGVLLQASKYGKPVIASDTGHLAEFVTQRKTGILYKPKNTQSLADAYDKIAFMDQLGAERLNEAIHQTAREHVWSNLVKRYLKIFELP